MAKITHLLQTLEVKHLEKRTVDGKVLDAGDNADSYNTFNTKDDVPSRYNTNSDFDELSYDPATGQTNSKTRQEAMAGLEAVSQGVLPPSITRDSSGAMEFFDGTGSPWDVKGPRGGQYFNVNQSGPSIRKELRDKGPVANSISGILEDRKVILDCSYINSTELDELRNWLSDNLTSSELLRIVEVNANLK